MEFSYGPADNGPKCFTTTGERLLPVSAVSRRLRLTPRMIRYLIAAGKLSGLRRGRKLLFCRESEVRDYSQKYAGQRRRHER